jgi:hypothetical protein
MTLVVLSPRPLGATVEEQRARLPPAAECKDPIEGIWLGHYYDVRQRTWYRRSLEIRRTTPGGKELKGEIVSHFWDGSAKDEKPPPCRPGQQMEQVVKMPSVGTVNADLLLDFGGTSWTAEPAICKRGWINYAPDHFTGKVDPKIQEFQSVNNDGAEAVNEPNVFRRVRCFEDAAPAPTGPVKPPAFEPPGRSLFSCGPRP